MFSQWFIHHYTFPFFPFIVSRVHSRSLLSVVCLSPFVSIPSIPSPNNADHFEREKKKKSGINKQRKKKKMLP